jgi:phosphoglycolate phosphatase
MDRLILFDIDGTLTKGDHSDTFAHGFKTVYGVEAELLPKGYPGMTDQQIILDVLTGKGLDRETIMKHMNACMEEMVKYYESTLKDRVVEPCEGVPELLEELGKRDVMLGLVTGNVEGIAWTKLGKVGLAGYFRLGCFGSDHPDRTELAKLAIRRAETLGFKHGGEVIVIGDTHRDVAAGKGAGARTIAVYSGHEPREMFDGSGADYLLESLGDTKRVLDIIG